MSDGLKRLFSRGRSRRREADSRPQHDFDLDIPAFAESRYEDVSAGAPPAEGLLPLRGNRMFAVRQDSDDIPQPMNLPFDSTRTSEASSSRFRRFRSLSRHRSRPVSTEREPYGIAADSVHPAGAYDSAPTSRRWSGIGSRSRRTSRRGSPTRSHDAQKVASEILGSTNANDNGASTHPLNGSRTRSQRASRRVSPQREPNPAASGAGPTFAISEPNEHASRHVESPGTRSPRITRPISLRRNRRSSADEIRDSLPRNDHLDSSGAIAPMAPYEGRTTRPKNLEPAWYLRRDSSGQRLVGAAGTTAPETTVAGTPQQGIAANTSSPARHSKSREHHRSIEGVIDGLDWLDGHPNKDKVVQSMGASHHMPEPGTVVGNGEARGREISTAIL
jgi:hypothetical protein